MPVRTTNARWEGQLKEGSGSVTLEEGRTQRPYSFASRFEGGEGTNPEELLGAAEASCLAMAVTKRLEELGHTPRSVEVEAHVNLDTSGPTIHSIDLKLRAGAEGVDQAKLEEIAGEAKKTCPISRALAAVEISLEVALDQ